MSSQRRINASRRNGALSRGPKTEAGKRRSSQNALSHGLLAKQVVLSNESEQEFQVVLNQYVEKFAPRDGVEFGMVEEMASCHWRLRRAMGIETTLFDKIMDDCDHVKQPERIGEAWHILAQAPSLQTLLRYQTTLQRMHQRAMNNLLLLRKIDPGNAEVRSEPSPISGHLEARPPAPANSQPHALPRPPRSAQIPPDPLIAANRPPRTDG